jgi:ABC-type glycerol-3-phosphate transport system permease component
MVDGATPTQAFWRIILPLVAQRFFQSALTVVAVKG